MAEAKDVEIEIEIDARRRADGQENDDGGVGVADAPAANKEKKRSLASAVLNDPNRIPHTKLPKKAFTQATLAFGVSIISEENAAACSFDMKRRRRTNARNTPTVV